jgi:hypothetical protein
MEEAMKRRTVSLNSKKLIALDRIVKKSRMRVNGDVADHQNIAQREIDCRTPEARGVMRGNPHVGAIISTAMHPA